LPADAAARGRLRISIPTGAAVEPLNPNDANLNRLFVISGVGATQVCAVVGGGNNAATTRCTPF
jgi:hypothetical protein